MPAVIFDLDGTLIDLFDLHLMGFKEVIKQDYGLDFERADLTPYYGRTAEEIAKAFFVKHGVSGVDYGRLVSERRDWVIDNINTCRLLPGAQRLLDELKAAGVPLALATANTPETGEAIVGACGLGGYFKVRVFRTQDLRGKPAPDIFLKAAVDLGVDPRECVVVEDSVYGVHAGKAAGMKVVAVASGTHGRDELAVIDPDLLVDSLEEVDYKLVTGLLGRSSSAR
jgi:HAD superfamily hydrolase (TIGR01509 family)